MKQTLLFIILVFCCAFISAQTIGIVGPAANGWPDDNNPTPDIMLTDNGDGTHSISALTLTTGSAKFRTNQNWNDPNYGGDTFPTGSITNGDIPVQAGIYDIVLDLNNNTYSFTDVGGFTEVTLSGTAIVGGSNPQMSTLDGESYTLIVTEFGSGGLTFQVGSDSFGTNTFPTGTATNGGAEIPVVAGHYSVTFNSTSGDFAFTVAGVGIVGPGSPAGDWPPGGSDFMLTTNDNGFTYTAENVVLTDGQLKFRQNQNWDVNWGGDTFPSGSFTSNDIQAVAGTYNITFNRTAGTYDFADATLSLVDESLTGFKLYPNPSSTLWFVENPNMAIASITLYDSFGRTVSESTPQSTTAEIGGSAIATGMYFAKIRLDNGNEKTLKIMKR